MKVMHCEMVAEQASAYVSKSLPKADLKAIELHLEECESCRAAVHRFRAVEGLLEYVQIDPQQQGQGRAVRQEEEELEEVGAGASSDSVFARMGAAPWWMVSCALHVLVIALASLISMSIGAPKADDSVIMVTE